MISQENADVYYDSADRKVFDFVLPNGSIIPCSRSVYIILKKVLIV